MRTFLRSLTALTLIGAFAAAGCGGNGNASEDDARQTPSASSQEPAESSAGTGATRAAPDIEQCFADAGVEPQPFEPGTDAEELLMKDSASQGAMTLDFSGLEDQFGKADSSGQADTPAAIDIVVYADAAAARKHADLVYEAEFDADPDDRGLVRVHGNVVVNPADAFTPAQRELLDSGCLPPETDS